MYSTSNGFYFSRKNKTALRILLVPFRESVNQLRFSTAFSEPDRVIVYICLSNANKEQTNKGLSKEKKQSNGQKLTANPNE